MALVVHGWIVEDPWRLSIVIGKTARILSHHLRPTTRKMRNPTFNFPHKDCSNWILKEDDANPYYPRIAFYQTSLKNSSRPTIMRKPRVTGPMMNYVFIDQFMKIPVAIALRSCNAAVAPKFVRVQDHSSPKNRLRLYGNGIASLKYTDFHVMRFLFCYSLFQFNRPTYGTSCGSHSYYLLQLAWWILDTAKPTQHPVNQELMDDS